MFDVLEEVVKSFFCLVVAAEYLVILIFCQESRLWQAELGGKNAPLVRHNLGHADEEVAVTRVNCVVCFDKYSHAITPLIQIVDSMAADNHGEPHIEGVCLLAHDSHVEQIGFCHREHGILGDTLKTFALSVALKADGERRADLLEDNHVEGSIERQKRVEALQQFVRRAVGQSGLVNPEVNATASRINGRIAASIKEVTVLLVRRTGEVLVRMKPLTKGGAHFITMNHTVIGEGPFRNVCGLAAGRQAAHDVQIRHRAPPCFPKYS
ncbi:MAG TPA: hypothetical protein [Caudoviricetes sp.]|nr:MAG TPA: hypothetical protein [Caudoviricetes sp.]